MRIDNWPLDAVMRLPDWCFGRRWWVGLQLENLNGTAGYGISEEQLPDKFVVWGVLISSVSANCLQALCATLRLGDHLPVDVADTQTMTRLLKGISTPGFTYEFYIGQNETTWVSCERGIVEAANRRLTVATFGDGAIAYSMNVGVQISALPKEVPDWLISGQVSNLF